MSPSVLPVMTLKKRDHHWRTYQLQSLKDRKKADSFCILLILMAPLYILSNRNGDRQLNKFSIDHHFVDQARSKRVRKICQRRNRFGENQICFFSNGYASH